MELPAVWFIVMCFHLKLPWGGGERRRGENSKSLGIKFPTTINTWGSNSPCLSLPRENKCIKVRENALKGNVFRWKENNQEWGIKAKAGSIWRCWKAWVEQLFVSSTANATLVYRGQREMDAKITVIVNKCGQPVKQSGCLNYVLTNDHPHLHH